MTTPSQWTEIDADQLRRRIGEQGISLSFARSGGPGGQNVNKVNTRATVWFDLRLCHALRDEEKSRIRRRLAGRISREGLIRVVSSRHRTQAANRAAAEDRLFELLAQALRTPKPRRTTRIPQAARQRRLQDKLSTGQRKRMRCRPSIDD